MVQFNVRWIEMLQPSDIEYHWDDRVCGLGLWVGETGKKTFVVDYVIRGTNKRRRVKLGRYGQLTLDQARDRAMQVIAAGLEGRDRIAEDCGAALKQAGRPRLKDVTDKWMKYHVERNCSPRTIYDYEKVLRSYVLPDLGELFLDELSRERALDLHDRLKGTPKVADYAVVVAKSAINFGIRETILPPGYRNPFAGLKLYGGRRRERFLQNSEVIALGKALQTLLADRMISVYASSGIQLLALTGARKSEILQLKWDQIDFDRGMITLVEHKAKRTGLPRSIQLSEVAIAILKSLPRADDNPYVIVGQKQGQSMKSLNVPWRRVCDLAQIKECRLHDLRHTFASFGLAGGLSLPMIGKLLGHTGPATTARYSHLADEARRRANEVVAGPLGELLCGSGH
jgi:integrase